MMTKPIDLRAYHKFGLSLLQLMLVIGTAGLVLTAIHFYFN